MEYSQEELRSYLVMLHKRIHRLLIYKEEEFPALIDYFGYVEFKLHGLRSVLHNDHRIVELYVLLEAAKLEASKEDYNHELYRKAILDAHGVISSIEQDLFHE